MSAEAASSALDAAAVVVNLWCHDDAYDIAEGVMETLGVPLNTPTSTITRALARDAAIERMVLWNTWCVRLDNGIETTFANDVLNRLRAVGFPVPGSPT